MIPGDTLLHVLVETFTETFDMPLFKSFLKVLVQHNFNLMNSETCVQGETALFLAVKSSKLKFAMLLVANGYVTMDELLSTKLDDPMLRGS